jgi:hypothetical protein
MYRSREKFFTCSGLARDQDTDVARRYLLRQRKEFLHRGRRPEQFVKPARRARLRAQALDFLLGGVKFVSSAQNQAKLDHVRRIRHAVVRAVLHDAEEQRAVFFVAEHHDGRVEGYLTDLIHEAKTRLVIAICAGSAEIQEYYVAPVAKIIETVKVELVDPACRKAIA